MDIYKLTQLKECFVYAINLKLVIHFYLYITFILKITMMDHTNRSNHQCLSTDRTVSKFELERALKDRLDLNYGKLKI